MTRPMRQFNVIKMCDMSPLHIGDGRDCHDSSSLELHSDTLTAALAAMGIAAGAFSDAREFLSSFRMSSAFPYHKGDYFLPKPQGRICMTADDAEAAHKYRKRLKSIKYVEKTLWDKMLKGESLRLDAIQAIGDVLAPACSGAGSIRMSQVSQRVSAPHDGGEATPFFFDWLYYAKDAGLYCITDADGGQMDLLIKLFGLLGEEGIGTDKSAGGGKFNIKCGTIEIDEPDDADCTMLLSLYIPTEEETGILLAGAPRYSILPRGGYMAGSSVERLRHLRKKGIYMFGEGSVFHTVMALGGKIVDLRPDCDDTEAHPVLRCGMPLTAKAKLYGNE